MKLTEVTKYDVLAAPCLLVVALATALGGCVFDSAEGPDEAAEEPIGTSAEALQTVNLPGNVSCVGQAAVEAELTSFVGKLEANLLADPRGGVAGYSIFASRRLSANSPLCAVAASGGMARTAADFPPAPMTLTTTSGVGSVAKVITAAYVIDLLKTYGIALDTPIGPYLPPTWVRGPGVNNTTFRELLTYTSAMPANTDSMAQWVHDGCLPGPTLGAQMVQTNNPYFGTIKGVRINVDGTMGADKVVITTPGALDSAAPLRTGTVQVVGSPPDGEPVDGSSDFYFLPAGDYVARLYFGPNTPRQAEIPFHTDAGGTVTVGQSNFTGPTCPFRGGRRYNNAGYKILALLAAYISQSAFRSYLTSPDQLLPVPPMQVAGQYEDTGVRANLLKPIYDGYTPLLSGDPSCNSYKSYYAWAYPAFATQATQGVHDIPDYYQSCGQGTWYLSAQDLNLLLDRLHWGKVGSGGEGLEAVVGQDLYGNSLHYGYDPNGITGKNIPYTVKGGYLKPGGGVYQAIAAHFPADTTVSLLVNSQRDTDDKSVLIYAPLNKAWDDSHPGTLWLDKSAFNVGETINIHFSGGPATPRDWIGVYPRNAVPASPSSGWDYCASGTQTLPSVGVSGGVVSFAASAFNSGTKQWTAYYLPNDGYQSIAQVDFDIKP